MAKPFSPENFPYTFVHDDLHAAIKTLRGTAVKVLLFIMKTSRIDFTHFQAVKLSVNEIEIGAGVAHSSVSPALEQLIAHQIVTREIVGLHPGTHMPLYVYSLNLNYEAVPEIGTATMPKIGTAMSEIGTATMPKIGTAMSEIGTATMPKIGTAMSEIGTADTMNSVELFQSVPQNIEQGSAGDTDHDHDDDDHHVIRDFSDADLIARFRRIRVYNAHARQIIDKHGLEGAWRWYAYVLDQENNVDLEKVERYLWTAAIKNGDSPPIPYRLDEIDELEAKYYRRLAARQAMVSVYTETSAESAPPDPLAELWNRMLLELRMQMTQATFDRWLAPTALISVDGDRALVAVSDSYAKEWLTARLKPIVLRTLAAIAQDAGYTVNDVIFEEVSYVQNPA